MADEPIHQADEPIHQADEPIHQADDSIRHNQSVIMTVIIYTQDHSDATRGNQRQSEAITCNHVHSEAISSSPRACLKEPSEAMRVVLSSNQWQ